MTPDQELVEIGRERLEMERKRDKHANFRFLVGTVFLAVATTVASIWLSSKQSAY